MPPVANATHITIGGTLSGGEIWQTGAWYLPNDPPATHAAFEADLAGIVADWTADLNSFATTFLDGDSRINEIRAYRYGGGSTQAIDVTSVDVNIPGTGASTLPNQCALVVTIQTGRPGRSYRGRMYLPANGLTVPASGAPLALTQANVTSLAEFMAGFVSVPLGTNYVLGVSSSRQNAFTPAVTISLDGKIDTQRRRSESQAITAQATEPVNQV